MNDWQKVGEIQRQAESKGFWMELRSPVTPGKNWTCGFMEQPHPSYFGWDGIAYGKTAHEAAENAWDALKQSNKWRGNLD